MLAEGSPSSMQHGLCQSVYLTSLQCLRGTLSRSTGRPVSYLPILLGGVPETALT